MLQFLSTRPTKNCNGFSDCMLEDGWKWIGGGPIPSQEIEPSHQTSVDLLEIRKPTSCVTLTAKSAIINGVFDNLFELQDQDCTSSQWIICTISYGLGLGASIGKDIKYHILSILTRRFHYVYPIF